MINSYIARMWGSMVDLPPISPRTLFDWGSDKRPWGHIEMQNCIQNIKNTSLVNIKCQNTDILIHFFRCASTYLFSTENDQNFIWSYMVRVKKFFNRNFLWNQFCNVSRAQNNQFQCYNSKKACLRDETNGVILSWTTGKTQPIGSKYRLFIYSIFLYYYLWSN